MTATTATRDTTFNGRLWVPSHYGITGDGPDGTRRITIGPIDGETTAARRALGVDLAHLANRISDTDVAVLNAIRASGVDHPSAGYLARATGYATATILASADRLTAAGYLTRPSSSMGRLIQLAPAWRLELVRS
jgi:hypothetical protein